MNSYLMDMNQGSRTIKRHIKQLYLDYQKSNRKDVIKSLISEWKQKHSLKLEEEREYERFSGISKEQN